MPSKNTCTMVPSAHLKSSLSKLGAYWPCHNEQWCWLNARKDGPKSVAPPLHEVAWRVGDPRSRTMGTVRVSAVRLCSTHLKTLSASLAGGPPVAVGRRLLLVPPLVEDVVESSRSLSGALVPHLYIEDT
jgi:hypothetical protein